MFFVLSKALAFILTPSNFLVLIGLLGLVLILLRWSRSGRSLLITAILGVALAGWSPLGPTLLMTLEDRFPKQEIPSTITGIVMLGGAVDIHITQARGSEAWNEQAERITAVAELANRFPAARIILSGGSGHPDAISESSITKRALAAMGVPEVRMEFETRSRNTRENASESVITAKPKSNEVWLPVAVQVGHFYLNRAVSAVENFRFKDRVSPIGRPVPRDPDDGRGQSPAVCA